MNGYEFGAIVVLLVYGIYLINESRKSRNKYPPKSDPLPPLPAEEDKNDSSGLPR